MPYGIYLRLLDILDDKDRSEIDKQVAIIAALDGKTETEVLDLPLDEFKKRTAALEFLEKPAPEPVPVRPPNRITLGGISLRLVGTDALNTAQFIDFEQFVQMGHRGYVNILSVFLVPPGKTYGHTGDDDPKAYDIEAVRRAIADNLTVTRVEAASAFFLKRWRLLLLRSMTSLETRLRLLLRMVKNKERREEISAKLTALHKLGAGLMQS